MIRIKFALLRLMAWGVIFRFGLYLMICGLVIEGNAIVQMATSRAMAILAWMGPELSKIEAVKAQRIEA